MRYITSCSGASWFNLPFFFTNESASAFLGPYKPPEQLAVHNLTNLDAAGSFGRAVARASFVLAGAMAQPCELLGADAPLRCLCLQLSSD